MPAPSQTGSILQIQNSATSANQNIAIPADAELCLVLVTYWTISTGQLNLLTLGGNVMSHVVRANNNDHENATIWRYVLPVEFRGTSRSLAWQWSTTLGEGAHFFILFLKDVNTSGNPIRGFASGSAQFNGTTTTPAFASNTIDLCLCVVASYQSTDANAAPAGSGQTEIADSNLFNLQQGAVGSKPGVSGTTTMSGSGDYRAVCACSVIGVLDPLDVYPGVASIGGETVLGGVELSTLELYPGVVSVGVTGLLGGVQVVEAIPPLGEGDTPGFVLWMLANSYFENLSAAGWGEGLEEPDGDNSATWGGIFFAP